MNPRDIPPWGAQENPVAQVASVLNCGGYLLVLLYTLMRYGDAFFVANVAASLVLLGLAVMFWVRERSRFATFVYAMTGYAALNMALIKALEGWKAPNGLSRFWCWERCCCWPSPWYVPVSTATNRPGATRQAGNRRVTADVIPRPA